MRQGTPHVGSFYVMGEGVPDCPFVRCFLTSKLAWIATVIVTGLLS